MQKQTHIFDITHESEVDNCVYTGTFSCKKLSIMDRSRINSIYNKLNGGLYYDENLPGVGIDEFTSNMNYSIAMLQVSLVDKPEWWNLDKVSDFDLFHKVLEEVTKFQSSFWRTNSPDSDGSGTDGGQKDNKGSKPSRVSGKVVDREIQASLEP